ncbi:MAG: hypothetical protein K5888_02920, partial [Lachnospiraceae bacterium]|nr:hypothetical protein [Lachnospiraceae bacterium]
MEKLDFLFLYEHKVRELESLCLAKYELDRRGYRTKIVYIDSEENMLAVKPLYDTKVVCMMACYNNHTAWWHVQDYVKFEKIIDLQWENIVYPKDEEREGAFKNYSEIGKEVVHVSWGKMNERRLLNAAHLDRDKVKLTGHMGMDYLRPPLDKYYVSREELFKKYNLPVDCKAILFASTYYGDSLPQSYIDDMCRRFGDDWTVYYKFMLDSQKIVIDWFIKLIKTDPDIHVIYRPHPGHPTNIALETEKNNPQFHVIADESVKQWILTCDKIYTGNGSVVVEAFFAKKMCGLLFPLPVTEGYELKLVSNATHIKTYEEFEKSANAEKEDFPVPEENIEEIYLIDWENYNFRKFADMAEEVLKDDKYNIPKKIKKAIYPYTFKDKVIKALCRITPVYNIYLKMLNDENNKSAFIVNQRKKR